MKPTNERHIYLTINTLKLTYGNPKKFPGGVTPDLRLKGRPRITQWEGDGEGGRGGEVGKGNWVSPPAFPNHFKHWDKQKTKISVKFFWVLSHFHSR